MSGDGNGYASGGLIGDLDYMTPQKQSQLDMYNRGLIADGLMLPSYQPPASSQQVVTPTPASVPHPITAGGGIQTPVVNLNNIAPSQQFSQPAQQVSQPQQQPMMQQNPLQMIASMPQNIPQGIPQNQSSGVSFAQAYAPIAMAQQQHPQFFNWLQSLNGGQS